MIDLPETLRDGRYEVDGLIGSGGMAMVLLARDKELGRPVAIKLLAGNLAADDGIRSRFVRESRIAARLSHPNVVRVYDAYEGERPYFVMEYVDGPSVAEELLRDGHLEWRRALEIACQACAGLGHAHRAGIIHRDIKPSNLLVDGAGTVKVADFGIAILDDGTRLTASSVGLGSLPYLAPERLRDPRGVTAAADIYGLGVVVYELIAGCRPFPCDTLEELLESSCNVQSVSLSGIAGEVPDALEEIVRRCLAPDPTLRPPSATVLADELSALVASSAPLPAPPAGSGAEGDSTVELAPPVAAAGDHRQRRILAAASALTVIAILAVVGVLLSRGGHVQAGSVQPPPSGASASPAKQANALAHWLRAETQPPRHAH